VPKRKAFLLRISPDLWEEISGWAADELRSVNGQIEFLLRQAVRRHRTGKRQGSGARPPGRSARGRARDDRAADSESKG
jgi:hypothetical protein